jgi:hypothetical protein
MTTAGRSAVTRALPGLLSRLKHPQLFLLLVVLFGLDLIVPDLIPFVDEIVLALVTVLVGTWRRPPGEVPPPPPQEPPPALPGS